MKKLVLIVVVLAGFITLLYTFTDVLDETAGFADSKINPGRQVTYYQWTDQSGEMIISRDIPSSTVDYISFQGSADLMKDENIKDPSLAIQSDSINTGQAQASQNQSSNKKGKNSGAGSNLGYPFSAIGKTKTCVNLANKISMLRADGKDVSALLKQQAKDC